MQDAIANASFLYLICQITSETVQKNSGNKDKLFSMHLLCISINQMHPTEKSFHWVSIWFIWIWILSFQNKNPLWKCITGALIEYFKFNHLKVIWTDIIDCYKVALSSSQSTIIFPKFWLEGISQISVKQSFMVPRDPNDWLLILIRFPSLNLSNCFNTSNRIKIGWNWAYLAYW